MNIQINQQQLMEEIQKLACFSDTPLPSVTRVVFSPVDIEARAYVKGLCAEAGLQVREDAVGNTFARWIGTEPDLAAVGTGSHIDAIPHAGQYDGTVGVLGGLEAIRALQRAGVRPKRSIELLLFTSEEPTRFGIGCLGSRLLSGSLSAGADTGLADREGKTLEENRRAAGFTASLEQVTLPAGYYDSFVELHIEQGPLLEQHNLALGVVTAIAAPATLRIVIEGEGGHAGAVLMPVRRDAFLGAAEIALAVESAAKATGAIDTVGTVGVCDIFPGAVNSIPSRVKMEVDIRDIEMARRDGVLASVREACSEIGKRRNLSIRVETLNADAPAQSSPKVLNALVGAAESLGLPYLSMVSRAYHDSLFMSRIAPVAMLFIRCRGGVSHRPDEYSSPDDIGVGALVLSHTLAKLAGS
jgi:ureidoglycolate amidohydrolase